MQQGPLLLVLMPFTIWIAQNALYLCVIMQDNKKKQGNKVV